MIDNPKTLLHSQPIRIRESVSPVYVFRTKREDPTNTQQAASATSCHGGVRIHHAGPVSIFKLQVCCFICGLLAHRLWLLLLESHHFGTSRPGKGSATSASGGASLHIWSLSRQQNFTICKGPYNACPLGLGLLIIAVCVSTVPRLLRGSVKGLTLCTCPSF